MNNFNDFNNFGNDNGRIPERDREIEDNGNTKHFNDKERRESMGNNPYGNYGNNSYGGGNYKPSLKERFSRNKGGMGKGNGYSNSGRGGGKSGTFLGVIFVFLCLVLIFSLGSGGFGNLKRSLSRTPEENTNQFFQSIKTMENQKNTIVKQRLNGEEMKLHKVYDYKNIYSEQSILHQVEAEYIVYVYTKNEELDKEFNDFVEKNEKNYVIYRLLGDSLKESFGEVSTYYEDKPMLVIVNEPIQNEKLIDSIVDDSSMLSDVPEYMEGLIYRKENLETNYDGTEKPKWKKDKQSTEEDITENNDTK